MSRLDPEDGVMKPLAPHLKRFERNDGDAAKRPSGRRRNGGDG